MTRAGLLGVALLLACKSDPKGLPPAGDWDPNAKPPPPAAQPEPKAGSGAFVHPPIGDGSGFTHPPIDGDNDFKHPPVDGVHAGTKHGPDPGDRFTPCFIDQLAKAPIEFANSLGILARQAPAAEARAIILAVAHHLSALPEAAQTKVIGEAGWALAELGDRDAAKQLGLAGAARPGDGAGGRLTAFAVLGRVGEIDEGRRLADGWMALDALAYGAALGGHVADAKKLRTELETGPGGDVLATSAIHLKLVAALGDVATLRATIAKLQREHAPSQLVIMGAIVEGGAQHHDDAVMKLGIAAIDATTGEPSGTKARALVGAAGTAAAAKSKAAVDDAIARFEKQTSLSRTGVELVPAMVYSTLGDHAEAERRFAATKSGDADDRAMFAAGLGAAAGHWEAVHAPIPQNAVLLADVWGRVLAAKLPEPERTRILNALCPP